MRFFFLLFVTSSLFAQSEPAQAPETAPAPNAAQTAVLAPLARHVPQEERRRAVFAKERASEAENAYRYAVELHGEGYRAGALEALRDFQIRFPGHERTFFVRMEEGDILREMGEILDAVNLDLETCRMYPREERAGRICLRAAKLLRRSGDTDRARAVFKEVTENFPASGIARQASAELSIMKEAESSPEPDNQQRLPEEVPTKEEKETIREAELPGQGVFDTNGP